MTVELSLEFSTPLVYTKCCGGSIERENVYVTYTTLSLSVVIVVVLNRDQKRLLINNLELVLNATVGVVWYYS